jgi:hypothetical protein
LIGKIIYKYWKSYFLSVFMSSNILVYHIILDWLITKEKRWKKGFKKKEQINKG